MERLRTVLSSFEAVKILDVATGSGMFLDLVTSFLPSTAKPIGVGIDQNEKHVLAAQSKYAGKPFQFMVMDSHQLAFEDQSFDIVCISNSLHHMKMPEIALSEMVRVLKPKGLLIVFEMVCDQQNARQETHVLMHHYWAKIDTAMGIEHAETYSRDGLNTLMAKTSGMIIQEKWEIEDEAPTTDNEDLAMLEQAVTSYCEKTSSWEGASEYKRQADALVKRIRNIGFESATECLWVLKKFEEN